MKNYSTGSGYILKEYTQLIQSGKIIEDYKQVFL